VFHCVGFTWSNPKPSAPGIPRSHGPNKKLHREAQRKRKEKKRKPTHEESISQGKTRNENHDLASRHRKIQKI
jgi:hypothetical protein